MPQTLEEKRKQKERRARRTPEQILAASHRDYAKKKTRPEWREKALASMKEFRRKNPGKSLAYCASRRARKLQATPAWADKKKIQQVYNLAAYERKMTGLNVQVDHIVPLKGELVCGLHVHYNLQITISYYNNKKNNRHSPQSS